jgi:hypothetical protein
MNGPAQDGFMNLAALDRRVRKRGTPNKATAARQAAVAAYPEDIDKACGIGTEHI